MYKSRRKARLADADSVEEHFALLCGECICIRRRFVSRERCSADEGWEIVGGDWRDVVGFRCVVSLMLACWTERRGLWDSRRDEFGLEERLLSQPA